MSGELGVLQVAAAGMEAQRAALDLAARNVAAAQTSEPRFDRLVPRYVTAADGEDARPFTSGSFEGAGWEFDAAFDDEFGAVDPWSPGAASGVVRYAGADLQRGAELDAMTEMITVLNAQRAYEANATVFDAGKHLAERTIDVGRS